MNIFPLDKDPRLAAQYNIDAHVRKIPVEVAQMFASVMKPSELLNAPRKADGGVRSSDARIRNHPVTKWVMGCEENKVWTLAYGQWLTVEQGKRFNRTDWITYDFLIHCWQALNVRDILTPQTWPAGFPKGATCRSLPNWNELDPIQKYRAYYECDKRVDKNGRSMLRWTGREMPEWFDKTANKQLSERYEIQKL